MRNYKIEKASETREYLIFEDQNAKGEKISIEFVRCTDSDYKRSLPKLWKKKGYIDRVLKTYWSIDVMATDKKGTWGRYNPQVKLSEDDKRQIINFEWMFEATPENKKKLIEEVERLAF